MFTQRNEISTFTKSRRRKDVGREKWKDIVMISNLDIIKEDQLEGKELERTG